MKKKILLLLCAVCFVLPIAFILTGCNNKTETYNVNFDYGKATSFFETNTTSVSVNSNEWITTIPNIKDEYKDSFLGWFVKGSDTEIKNNSFIGADCILEARFDINEAPSGLYQNGMYVMTWEEITTMYPETFVEDGEIGIFGYQSFLTELSGELVIDTSILSINMNAFKDCNKLNKIIIPDSVTTIGDGAFENCTELKEIKLPNKLKTIQANTFKGCVNLEDVQISKSVESINRRAFEGCTSLTEITIPKNVTFITEWAFKDCVNLSSVTINGDIDTSNGDIDTSFGIGVFDGCLSLEYVTISEGVRRLSNLFAGCSNIKSIDLPSTLEYIGSYVFSNCSSLKEIYIPSNVLHVGVGVFAGCDSLAYIYVSKLNETFIDTHDHYINRSILINKKTNTIVGGQLSNFSDPAEISYNGTIGDHAFSTNNNLSKLIISANKISDGAFYECKNLNEVEISGNVMEISVAAFYGCIALEKFILNNAEGYKWQICDNNTWVDVSTLDNDTLIRYLTTERYCRLKQVEI